MAFMDSINGALTNIYAWMVSTFVLLAVILLLIVLLFILAKKTHALLELKAWLKNKPIALFFDESRNVEWKSVTNDAGIVQDKNYGAFIVNSKASYIDKMTRATLLPFDASFGSGLNLHACKFADDLQYVTNDEEEMKKFRYAIANNLIEETDTITALKTNIDVGSLKTVMNALFPHNISSKIEKTIAARMKSYGQVNHMQIIIIFAAILGAILIGYLIIKLAVPK